MLRPLATADRPGMVAWLRGGWEQRRWSIVLLAAVVHAATALAAMKWTFFNEDIAPVWPPTGLAIALVALGGPRFAVAALLGAFVATLTHGMTLGASLGCALANFCEAAVGGWLLARVPCRTQPFDTVRQVVYLLFGSAGGAAVSALIGSTTFALAGTLASDQFWGTLYTWWLGNTMGGLVVAPAVASLLTWRPQAPGRRRRVEMFCALGLAAIAGLVRFVINPWQIAGNSAFVYTFPFIIWTGLRGSPRATASLNLLIGLISTWGTAASTGPFFIEGAPLVANLIRLQLFLFAHSLTSLILVAVSSERRHAFEAAARSERDLRMVLDHIPSVIWSGDEQGRTHFISRNVTSLLGVSEFEVKQQGADLFLSRVHPDDFPMLRTAWGDVFTSGFSECEYRFRKPNGEELWLLGRATSLDLGHQGKKLAFVALDDITRRKATESALNMERAILRSQSELSKDGILVVAKDRTRLGHNSRLLDIFHMPPEIRAHWTSEAALRHCQSLVVDPDHFLNRILELYPDPVGTCDDLVQFKDGRIVSRYSAPVLDEQGQHFGRVWYYRDVTAEKQAEQVLRADRDELERRVQERSAELVASHRMFQSMAALSPVGIFRTDPQGAATYVNERWQELAGLSFEESLGQGWSRAVHPDDRAVLLEAWTRAASRGLPMQAEFRMIRPDGQEKHVWGEALPILDEQQQLIGHVGTITDLTHRKHSEAQLHHQQTELAHTDRLHTIGEMCAALVHELSQPLSAIVNYAGGARRRIDRHIATGRQLEEVVGQVATEAERASQIVRRVRDFLRKQEPHRGRVDVNRVIRDVDELLSFEANRREMQVTLELADRLPAVQADRVELQQVLVNLIRNAFDAMSQLPERQRRVLVRTEPTSTGLAVSVKDQGPGLAQPGQVFEPFYTTKPDGLGLGLALSHSIVESLGGALTLTENTQQGATFRFTLPAADAAR